MAPENLAAVFGTFSQLPAGCARSQGGLGIGLSLVRALTEAHAGTVTAASPGLGQGSEFTVRLPLAPIQDLPKSLALPTISEPDLRRRILLVDDSEDAAVSLSMLLESDGHQTRIATTGAAALVMAYEFEAEVLLLDIGLPDISGYDVARRLRHDPRGKRMLLIAVTGWSQEHDKGAAFEAGFDYHLVKPVDYDRLAMLLTGMPGHRHDPGSADGG
ncbi:response regulator [Paraburkholderia youngii]|uniref:response regulator n=1 Tax=Paraburkholderia youngii TaxID=2782701 RepID=UPI003D23DA09